LLGFEEGEYADEGCDGNEEAFADFCGRVSEKSKLQPTPTTPLLNPLSPTMRITLGGYWSGIDFYAADVGDGGVWGNPLSSVGP